jgi:hypothetical protein
MVKRQKSILLEGAGGRHHACARDWARAHCAGWLTFTPVEDIVWSGKEVGVEGGGGGGVSGSTLEVGGWRVASDEV